MNTQTQKLASDIKMLVHDAEELVRATALDSGEKVAELRHRMLKAVNEVKPHIAALETAVSEKAKSAATCTDAYVRDNPWTAMGISAGVGVVIGLLISRG
jgi:ElaB/YqjD/DUF883 family membrane-anchored ribosome-binding protein